jgi:hypothetical protein
MPESEGKIKKFVHWIAPNAIWDLVKWIGGSSMLTSVWNVCSREFHKNPVDWMLYSIFFGVGLILVIVGAMRQAREAGRSNQNIQVKTDSRLKIVSAYYGIEGGPDKDVAEEYLVPKIFGHSLVGWVGSDLFGPLDPAIGKYKRLKVHYSFDGNAAMVVRQEHELLVLPEDKRLKEQLEECQRQSRLNENQFNAELSRAREIREQYAVEKREALERAEGLERQLAQFCSLQLEALQFVKRLQDFLKEELPSFPVRLDPATTALNEIHRRSDERIAWRKKVESKYELQFADEYRKLLLKFKARGIEPDRSFNYEGVSKIEDDVPARIGIVIAMVHEIDEVKLSARH